MTWKHSWRSRTTEVSDGDEPPMTLESKVAETAHPRSLHRLVRLALHIVSIILAIFAAGSPEAILSHSSKSCPCGDTAPEAPCAFNNFTNGRWPLCAARLSALSPNLLRAVTSAPRSMSRE